MKRRTKGHPILPVEVFWDLCDAFGDEISTEILDRVQEKRISVEEAKRYLKYAEEKREGNVCLYSFWDQEEGLTKRKEYGMVMWI